MNTRCASALIARSLATRSLGLALSLSIAMSSAAMAAPGDVNATHNVTNVAGGVYYNTAGSQTVFQATGSGLIVGAGTTVRALEVSNPASPAASLTNNGGSLRFRLPDKSFALTVRLTPALSKADRSIWAMAAASRSMPLSCIRTARFTPMARAAANLDGRRLTDANGQRTHSGHGRQ